jgi:hypothetical protein
MAALCALVACLSFASHASAWGTCGRGPWVTPPLGPFWSAPSECRCGSGQIGNVQVLGGELTAWATSRGPSNTGVGAEWEAIDNVTGEHLNIGMNFPTTNPAKLVYPSGTGTNYNDRYGRPPIDGSGRYSVGRYRSVCVTTISNLPKWPSYPWIWY